MTRDEHVEWPVTRDDHVEWVKARALAELDDTVAGRARAIGSVASDLGKHEETARHEAVPLLHEMAYAGTLRTDQDVRDVVEGIR